MSKSSSKSKSKLSEAASTLARDDSSKREKSEAAKIMNDARHDD